MAQAASSDAGIRLCDDCLESPAEVIRDKFSLCSVCAAALARELAEGEEAVLAPTEVEAVWSPALRDLVVRARQLAAGGKSDRCDSIHLLAALVSSPSGIQALEGAGLSEDTIASVWAHVSELSSIDPLDESPDLVDVFAETARLVLIEARALAGSEGMPEVTPRHLLEALRREEGGVASRVLIRYGLPPRDAEVVYEALEAYARNLTQEAARGELEPLVGRRDELGQVVETLTRRRKNNPVLIGEPGVGKTAVAEGLAQMIAANEVPASLRGHQLYALDLASLVEGARYRGDFERRLKGVVSEASAPGSKVILFIDELHAIIGAGAASGSLDAAAMLKPPLARGELKVIGATTYDDYKRVSRDEALERRFQPVYVGEPSERETLEILGELRSRYEAHHDVEISDAALEACVELSGRYLHEHRWPDKAIDVLDAAAARLALKDTPARRRREASLELKDLYAERERATANGYAGVCVLRERIDELEALLAQLPSEERSRLEASDVVPVVARKSGIGEETISQAAGDERLARLALLGERLVGQPEAIEAVNQALRRAEAGISDPRRPLSSFVFVGPTGVGKTEMARQLAWVLFNDEEALVRFDMGEYAEKHTVSRLLGAPPGYVGHDEGGQLTEAVRRKPYSVVLLDEIEKAHADVWNVLLAVLDEGFATDSEGRKVSFRNTVVVLTSNVGAQGARRGVGFGSDLALRREDELKKTFPAELLNRLDEVVAFTPLSPPEIELICRQQVDAICARVRQRQPAGPHVAVSERAVRRLAEDGFSDEYGARYLRRHLQRTLERVLADALLAGVPEGASLYIDVKSLKGLKGKDTLDVKLVTIAAA